MDCTLTCILVLVVRMLTICSCEFTQKYQYSPNNLITDFMNLSNEMFLFINRCLCDVFSLFPKCLWVARPETGPTWPIFPHFNMLAVDKQNMCNTCMI